MSPFARASLLLLSCALTSLALGCEAQTRLPAAVAAAAAPSGAGVQVMVVGTAHGGHLTTPGYPMTKLEDLLIAYAPDLVLVEIRPEAFAQGRYEDGPLEMAYLTLAARARGIAVEPIDWYLDGDVAEAPGDPECERIFERDYGELARKTDTAASFEALNSGERALAFLRVENARARLGVADAPSWHRRQSWFHERAAGSIARHGARRDAACVGFAHRPELAMYLAAMGMHGIDPTQVALGAPVKRVPIEVVAFWREALVRMRAGLPNEAPGMRARLARKLRSWEVAVEREGACCVDAHEFDLAPAAP